MEERQRYFIEVVKTLDNRIKTWIMLKYYEGMTDEEIKATLVASDDEVILFNGLLSAMKHDYKKARDL